MKLNQLNMRKMLAGFLSLFFILSVGSTAIASSKADLQDMENGILLEDKKGRMWQKKRSRSFKTYDDAKQYAENLSLGGYSDWRLPTIYELYDLHNLFDLKKTGKVKIKLEGNYWSGLKDGDGMVGSWEIGDQCEPERFYFAKKRGYVRVVRP